MSRKDYSAEPLKREGHKSHSQKKPTQELLIDNHPRNDRNPGTSSGGVTLHLPQLQGRAILPGKAIPPGQRQNGGSGGFLLLQWKYYRFLQALLCFRIVTIHRLSRINAVSTDTISPILNPGETKRISTLLSPAGTENARKVSA